MSKHAKALLKSLERSQAAARAQYSQLQAAAKIDGLAAVEAATAHLDQLAEYLAANAKLQTLLNVAYGEPSYEIAAKAVQNKPLVNN